MFLQVRKPPNTDFLDLANFLDSGGGIQDLLNNNFYLDTKLLFGEDLSEVNGVVKAHVSARQLAKFRSRYLKITHLIKAAIRAASLRTKTQGIVATCPLSAASLCLCASLHCGHPASLACTRIDQAVDL